jgi:hypothetical protein
MFKRGETFNCSMLITQIEEEKDEENMWFYYKKYIIIRIDINRINLGEFTGNMPIWSLNWMQVTLAISIVLICRNQRLGLDLQLGEIYFLSILDII